MDTVTWYERQLNAIHRAVQGGRWFVMGVGEKCSHPGCEGSRRRPDDLPDYAYTIGLPVGFDHPELIVIGLDLDVAHFILCSLAERIKAGARFVAGDVIDADEFVIKIGPCAPDFWRNGTIAMSNNYHHAIGAAPPTAVQVLWPDDAGRFPGDDGFDPSPVEHASLAFRPPRRHRRRRP